MECVLNDLLAQKCKNSVSSELSGEIITPLDGRFHYESFITTIITCGQIFQTSLIFLKL